MNVKKIYIAKHKPYADPGDGMYVPLQVGAALGEPFCGARDDQGENISEKNRTFCELTGLYWMWKNADADVIGLVHYRRHFAVKRGGNAWDRILTEPELDALLEKADVVLPKKRHYVIETNYSQYAHAHHEGDLRAAKEVILRRCPAYAHAFDQVMRRRSGHRFNMMIMRRERFDAYCGWLFPILFELEKRIDISGYDAYNRRVFGFIGERLLDVWLEHEKTACAEIPVIDIEPVNWVRKGGAFALRKLRALGGGSGLRRRS